MSNATLKSEMLPELKCYVNGKWVGSDSGKTIAVHNPATGELLAEIPSMTGDETLGAIKAACGAIHPQPSIEDRKNWLEQIAVSLEKNKDEIGRIVTLEHGKPWAEGKGETVYAAGFFKFCAEHIDELKPRTVPNVSKGGEWTVHQRPAGVAGLITPWNFPIGMIAKKLSAAIAAGCPSVIKPSSKTPLSMLALFTVLDRDLDLPPGFVNLVTGSAGTIGDVMCDHPDVRVISFTGSTEVGKELIDKTKHRVKRLSLELGGNAPYIVFDDADLESAADNLIGNKFRGGGQTCVCTNRVLVHKKVAAKFADLVADRVKKMKVGDGMEEGVDLGPLIDRAGWQKVRDHIEDALKKGAEAVHAPDPDKPDGDLKAFHPPTVIRKVTPEMTCCQEETFGPLVPIMEFETEEEAISEGNNTQFGLAAYVFTADDARAERVIARLDFGHVGWNTGTGPTPEVPFGGMKESGYGREGGLEGLHEFVEPQGVAKF